MTQSLTFYLGHIWTRLWPQQHNTSLWDGRKSCYSKVANAQNISYKFSECTHVSYLNIISILHSSKWPDLTPGLIFYLDQFWTHLLNQNYGKHMLDGRKSNYAHVANAQNVFHLFFWVHAGELFEYGNSIAFYTFSWPDSGSNFLSWSYMDSFMTSTTQH
jgi:hypothetical protein